MSTKIKDIARGAPPTGPWIDPVVIWLEKYIRKPLEGTLFDNWIASPAKELYIASKRRD